MVGDKVQDKVGDKVTGPQEGDGAEDALREKIFGLQGAGGLARLVPELEDYRRRPRSGRPTLLFFIGWQPTVPD